MKQYNETRVNLSNVVVFDTKVESVDGKEITSYIPKKSKDKEGNEFVVTEELLNLVEKKANEIVEFQSKQPEWPSVNIDKIQTFGYREVETLSEIVPMFEEAGLDTDKANEVARDIFNRGWVLAQQKEGRDYMLKTEAVEGVYDLLKDAATPAERRKADPMSKLTSALKALGFPGLNPADLVEMVKQFQQSQSVAQ